MNLNPAAKAESSLSGSPSEVARRIGELIELAGGPAAAARIAGKSADQLRRYAEGESAPPLEPIARLAGALGRSMDWVISGALSRSTSLRLEREDEQNGGLAVREAPGEGYVALPRYDVRASAGVGLPVLSEEVVDSIFFKADWLRRNLGLNPAQLALIETVGDSMAPGIEDGDLLLVDVGQPVLRGDGVYVLAMDHELVGLMVKRVELTPQGGLVISSDNKRAGYRDHEIRPGEVADLRFVGRVVWVGGRV